MASIRISEAQMTALETMGLFELPEPEWTPLAASINGRSVRINGNGYQIARIVCDMSNDADYLARSHDGDENIRAWASKDAKALSTLYGKILRAA